MEDRPLFLREYNDGLYPLAPYVACKLLIEVPACAAVGRCSLTPG